MHPSRHVRAAVAGVALSAVVALGMAGAAYAQVEPDGLPSCTQLAYQGVADQFLADLTAASAGTLPAELQSRYDADGDKSACDGENLAAGSPPDLSLGTGTTTEAARTGDDPKDDEDDSEGASPKASTADSDTGGDRDCADFTSQADAQAALKADESDPERLDADDDEIACEDHFKTEDDQVAVKPEGGVATGGDGR